MRRKATHERYSQSVPKGSGLKIGHYVLAIMLFGTAAINAGLAEEAARVSNQTDTALTARPTGGNQQGSSGDAAGAAIGGPAATGAGAKGDGGAKGDAAAKGNADANGDKTVGTTGDSGGIKGEPRAGSNVEWGSGTNGGVHAGAQQNGIGTNPIDIRITVQSPKSKNATKGPDWKKAKIVGPDFGDLHALAPGTQDGLARNAIGVLMPPGARNRGFAPAGVDGTAGSAVGTTAKNPASVGRPDIGRQISGPAFAVSPKANVPPVNAMNHSVLNGTSIGHPGSGTGVIGGVAKNVAGVINGSSFRPKHF